MGLRRLSLLFLVLAGAGLFWQVRERAPQPGPAPAPPPLPAPAALAPDAPLPPLPASLRDTAVDGALGVDAQGRFRPGPEALALFDYFLSATGEEPGEVIRLRIVTHVRATLPPDAATEAERLLDAYLAHRERMRALTLQSPPPADLERRLQWIREERRRSFGPELASALFAEDERIVAIDLERRRVLQDAAIPEEEKARRLEALDARLPEPVLEARRRASAPARVAREVETLRAAGASDAEVFAAREQAFGTEAAERLALLDRERAAFDAKRAAFVAERERLLADPSVPEPEKTAQVEALLEARFTESERIRVRALDEGKGAER